MREQAHVQRVVSTAFGRTSAVGQPAEGAGIRASWRRCLTEYGLEPDRLPPAAVLTRRELTDARAPIDDFVATAAPELQRLFHHLGGGDYIVMLTDMNGVTVDTLLGASLREQARASRSILGSVWAEESQGTNGIGTCLKEGAPLSVVMTDHFDTRLLGISCTVAPIRDGAGAIVAVLDVTTPRPSDHMAQALVRRTVALSARRIENLYVVRQYPGRRVLRLSRHADFADLANEARVVFDDCGRALAATSGAASLLDCEHATLLGRRLTDILPLAATPANGARLPALRGRAAGHDLYAVEYAPDAVSPRHVPVRATMSLIEPPSHDVAVVRAQRLLAQGVPLLLTGETGTGKTALARDLHERGPRAGRPFVAVNCAAMSPSLIEAELFGYRPGAFTGAAREGSPGLVRQADRGTLFLDEIGDMPISLQTRLLQVLSEGVVMPLGGGRPVSVDVAVISATVHDLTRLVAEGRFREDLYYRLAGTTLALPPLRARADRDGLVDSLFAEEARRAGRPDLALSEPARRLLAAHPWPGNLRELRQTLRYAVALADDATLLPSDLPPTLCRASPAPRLGRQRLAEALEASRWNVSATARIVGLSRATIHRKIAEWSLTRPRR